MNNRQEMLAIVRVAMMLCGEAFFASGQACLSPFPSEQVQAGLLGFFSRKMDRLPEGFRFSPGFRLRGVGYGLRFPFPGQEC